MQGISSQLKIKPKAGHIKNVPLSILLKLYTPPHSMCLLSSPSFHLLGAGVGVREQNVLVLFKALHPPWFSAGEFIAQHTLTFHSGFEA